MVFKLMIFMYKNGIPHGATRDCHYGFKKKPSSQRTCHTKSRPVGKMQHLPGRPRLANQTDEVLDERKFEWSTTTQTEQLVTERRHKTIVGLSQKSDEQKWHTCHASQDARPTSKMHVWSNHWKVLGEGEWSVCRRWIGWWPMNFNHFSGCHVLLAIGQRKTRKTSTRKLNISLRSCLHRLLHTEKAWL